MDADSPRVRFTRLGPIAANNVFGPHPSFRYEVAGFGTTGSGEVDESALARLAVALPGIREVRTCGEPGPVVLAHLVEHACIELQQLAGSSFWCTRAAGCSDDRGTAIIPYEDEVIFDRALRWVQAALEGAKDFDARGTLQEFVEYAGRKMLPAQDRMLIASAHQRDVPVAHVAGRTFTLGQGCHLRRISATKTSLTNIISNQLAANKDYSRRILQELGLPVPKYARVYSRRAALAAAERFGFPVVMKPIFGSMGRGVFVGVSGPRELRAAYRRVREYGRAVLVEELVAGDDYRLLVIDGKMCAAAKRMPGHVVGDGSRTVRELVDEVNRDPRRGHDHNSPLTRLELDEQAGMLLEKLGYDADTVPAPGETVFLRRNANLSTGGTAIDVTDEVHPETRWVAERTARAIGLDIAGVDLLTTDITRSIFETGGRICEINSRPGIRKHIWPVEGRSRDVTGPIIDMLFPGGSDGRIPVVAVVGEHVADLAAQMLAHILLLAGRRAGLGRAGRVYTGGIEHRREGRLTPPELIRGVLLDPDVDVAVLQFDLDGATEHGLDCDAFDLALVLDAGSGESAGGRSAKSGLELVLGATRELVVVHEADSRAASIEERVGGAEVVRLSGPESGPPGPASDADRAAAFAEAAARRLGIPGAVCREGLETFRPIQPELRSNGTRRRDRSNTRRKQ